MEGHGHHNWNRLKQIEKKRGMCLPLESPESTTWKKSDWDNGNKQTQCKGSMPQYL